MYIGKSVLERIAKTYPENIIRLATFIGIPSHNREIENVIDDLIDKINAWKFEDSKWKY